MKPQIALLALVFLTAAQQMNASEPEYMLKMVCYDKDQPQSLTLTLKAYEDGSAHLIFGNKEFVGSYLIGNHSDRTRLAGYQWIQWQGSQVGSTEQLATMRVTFAGGNGFGGFQEQSSSGERSEFYSLDCTVQKRDE